MQLRSEVRAEKQEGSYPECKTCSVLEQLTYDQMFCKFNCTIQLNYVLYAIEVRGESRKTGGELSRMQNLQRTWAVDIWPNVLRGPLELIFYHGRTSMWLGNQCYRLTSLAAIFNSRSSQDINQKWKAICCMLWDLVISTCLRFCCSHVHPHRPCTALHFSKHAAESLSTQSQTHDHLYTSSQVQYTHPSRV